MDVDLTIYTPNRMLYNKQMNLFWQENFAWKLFFSQNKLEWRLWLYNEASLDLARIETKQKQLQIHKYRENITMEFFDWCQKVKWCTLE